MKCLEIWEAKEEARRIEIQREIIVTVSERNDIVQW